MTGAQSIKLYDLFRRHFQNESDAKEIVEEVEHLVESRIESERKDFSTKTEVGSFRTDLNALKVQVGNLNTESKGEIEKSSLRVESNLKSEINKLIIWIVATILGTSAIMMTIAKFIF